MAERERPELGPRKSAVLRAVIEEFVRTGEPVGSETVAEHAQLGVSSATIRNEMSALEELGYLSHPHTSAGRTPTDLGYRHYVDALPARGKLPDTQRRAIAQFFRDAARDMEELVVGASRLLSQLTQYAGLAVPPSASEERILRAELLELGSGLMLLAVGQHGRVYKAVLERGEDITPAVVEAAERRLSSVGDLTLTGAAVRLQGLADEGVEGHALLAVLAEAFRGLQERAAVEHVVVGGMGNLAMEVATLRLDAMHRLFEALERQSEALRGLLEPVGDDVAVTIGGEHPSTGMWDAAVVAAPYRVGDVSLGTIGVVGPTRMNYVSAISTVRAVARRLSEMATELGG
jgi:heat-inducible transcriptional repressor